MARLALILIGAFALIGACFFYCQKEPEPEKKNLGYSNNIFPAATAVKDVEEGAIIDVDAISTRGLSLSKVPSDCATVSQAIGKKARFGLTKGQLVSQYDLDPFPPYLLTKAVRLRKDVSKGMIISEDAVEELEVRAGDLPSFPALVNARDAVGHKALSNLSKAKFLLQRDVVPN